MTSNNRMKRAFDWAQQWSNQTGKSANEALGEAWLQAATPKETKIAVQKIGSILDKEEPTEVFGPQPQIEAIDIYDKVGLSASVSSVLLTLTPKEHRVLALTFGMGPSVDEHTLEEVGDQLGIGKERVRQIQAKALRKLKHPSRSRLLRPHVDAGYHSSNFCYKKPQDQAPSWSDWRYALSQVEPKEDDPLWAWHGCPITRTLFESGCLNNIDDTRPWSKEVAPTSSMMIGGDKFTFEIWPGLLMVKEISFSSGQVYHQRTHKREGKKYKVTPSIAVDGLATIIAESIRDIRCPATNIIENPLFEYLMFEGCYDSLRGHSFQLTGYTAPLGRGSGKFSHPEGLLAA